jgi:hypothetical protein
MNFLLLAKTQYIGKISLPGEEAEQRYRLEQDDEEATFRYRVRVVPAARTFHPRGRGLIPTGLLWSDAMLLGSTVLRYPPSILTQLVRSPYFSLRETINLHRGMAEIKLTCLAWFTPGKVFKLVYSRAGECNHHPDFVGRSRDGLPE